VTTELLDPEAQAAVRERVAALESATGVELVAAVIPRADSYPEIPWRAFALGASFAGAAAVAHGLLDPGWSTLHAAAGTAIAMLAVGAAAALLTVWAAPFARLFLPRERRRAEVLQHAQAMFLEGDLHRTRRRDAILLLVSRFEHEIVLLPDRGIRERLTPEALAPVVAAITARLASGRLRDALIDGIARLHETLTARGFRAGPGDTSEIADDLLQGSRPS
jgi:putative membrane protein